MALTRKMLKGMGLTEEQADTIIEAHSETVDGLKEKLKAVEEKAAAADAVQKELDGLKAKGGEDYKARAEKAERELKDFKAEIAAKETRAAKEKAASAYFEGKNITGNNLEIAMMATSGLIDGLVLDGDKIKDTTSLDNLVAGKLGGLVVKTQEKGAKTSTPPAGHNGVGKLTRDEIYKRDDSGRFLLDATQRQEALSKLIAAEQQKG